MNKVAALFFFGTLVVHPDAYAGEDAVDLYLAQTKPNRQVQPSEIRSFAAAFENLKSEELKKLIEAAYAEELFFNDTLVTLHQRGDLIQYLQQSADKTNRVNTTILDVANSGADYYVRWLLDMEFEVLGGIRTSRTVGMSHLRFDETGRIVLHQDFWDSANGLYKHMPLVGSLMTWINSRLHNQLDSSGAGNIVSDTNASGSSGR